MIDEEGYRANVGIILCNGENQVFWGHRVGQHEQAWQFPQGGIQTDEMPLEAMYRELYEEVGLLPKDVELLGQTQDWLAYQFDAAKLTAGGQRYIGQRQQWFILRLLSDASHICLTTAAKPEFDAWHWVDYWYPVDHVIAFKRAVYQQALKGLHGYLMKK